MALPTPRSSNANVLTDPEAGQAMDQRFKLKMVNIIKTVYATTPCNFNQTQAKMPNINLASRLQ